MTTVPHYARGAVKRHHGGDGERHNRWNLSCGSHSVVSVSEQRSIFCKRDFIFKSGSVKNLQLPTRCARTPSPTATVRRYTGTTLMN